MKSLEQLVRKNIWSLAPYSSARDEYSGKEAHVFLDANENPYNAPYNRYPDPLQREVKKLLERVKGVPAENIFLGNGSDEAIDLPYRIFCEPGPTSSVARCYLTITSSCMLTLFSRLAMPTPRLSGSVHPTIPQEIR